MKSFFYVCTFLFIGFACLSSAKDIVYLNKGISIQDLRMTYKLEVLSTALEKTLPTYGDYEIINQNIHTVTQRALIELISAKTINLMMAVTTPELEKETIPIRIPIRRGILNFRLLAIHKHNAAVFNNITTLNELKPIIGGVRKSWATNTLMEMYELAKIETVNLDSVFKMLAIGRVQYIPRGINEIYDELASRKKEMPALMVEPNLVLYTQAPYYIFVSPKHPRLAKRIKDGLEMMVADDSLKRIFYKYFADEIQQANIKQRTVITLPNLNLPPETPLNRKELWFEYD